MKKKILVTGGLGYIGSHGVVAFEQAGYECVVIDNLVNSSDHVIENIERILGKKIIFLNGDIRDIAFLRDVFHRCSINGVIHFAGLKSPFESQSQALTYFDNNVRGSMALFEVMQEYDVKKIIFSSSANIYDSQDMGKTGLSEDAKVGNTSNPYGRSKYILEKILEDIADFSGFNVISLRYFNPIGAHSSGCLGENPKGLPNNLLPYAIRVLFGELPKLYVYGDDYNTVDGTGVRDYIDIEDLINGHILGYKYLEENYSNDGLYEAINLGVGKGVSVLEIIKTIEKISGKPLSYQVDKRRQGDLAEVYCNPSKACTLLGWKAEVPIEQSIENSIKFYSGQGNK